MGWAGVLEGCEIEGILVAFFVYWWVQVQIMERGDGGDDVG